MQIKEYRTIMTMLLRQKFLKKYMSEIWGKTLVLCYASDSDGMSTWGRALQKMHAGMESLKWLEWKGGKGKFQKVNLCSDYLQSTKFDIWNFQEE